MFDSVRIKHDARKDIYTINATFGIRFKNILEKRILNSKRLKQLFISYGPFEISFYGFFALEVRSILEYYIDLPGILGNVRLVNNVIKTISENTWLLDMDATFEDTFDYDIIKRKFKFSILKHQEVWFKEYISIKKKMHYRGRLLDASAGTGKTFMALATAELVMSNKILIISPLQAIDTVWVDSIKNTIYKNEETIYIMGSKNKVKYNNERFIICNYEAMKKLSNIIPEIKGKDTTILIDESHNLNELNSKRTNLLLQICNAVDSDNVLLLSGTPIKAKPLEMLPMIEMLDKRFDSVVKHRFIKLYKSMPQALKIAIADRYATYRTNIKKESINLPPVITKEISIKLKNAKEYTLDNIRDKMKTYVIKRRNEINNDFYKYEKTYYDLVSKAKEIQIANGIKEEVFKEYESNIKLIIRMYENRSLLQIPDNIKFCNKFEKEIIRPVLDHNEKKSFNEAKTIVKYLNLKLQGEVLGNVVGKERIRCHIDLAKEINYKEIVNSTLKKTLIFSNYIEVCETAYNTLNNIGYSPLRVYGDYTKGLTSTVDSYMVKGNNLNPLTATYKSLSTAIPLIVANVVLCIDLPFRAYTLEQSISRLHRLGQDTQVYVYQVQLDTGNVPNINSRNIDIIAWSAEMVSLITGEEVVTEVIKNEGSEDGALTVEGINFVNSFTTSMEECKFKEKDIEVNVYDAW